MPSSEGTKGLERIATILAKRPEQIVAASRRAQNRAANRAKTIASRRIRAAVALKKRYVDSKLRIRRYGDVVALEAKRRGVLLVRYQHKPVIRRGKPAGYRVKVATKGRAVHFRHVFPVPLRNQPFPGLAQRTGKERYQIEVLHAPSVSQELEWTMEEIRDEVAPLYHAEVLRQIGRLK